jgi:sensor histidine kinase regulating citrate/malate metabolism
VKFSVHNSKYIEPEVQNQLFKRSFSTKGVGRGFGTYSMKLFGEKYLKGKVWFESSPENGTTFFIEI